MIETTVQHFFPSDLQPHQLWMATATEDWPIHWIFWVIVRVPGDEIRVLFLPIVAHSGILRR